MMMMIEWRRPVLHFSLPAHFKHLFLPRDLIMSTEQSSLGPQVSFTKPKTESFLSFSLFLINWTELASSWTFLCAASQLVASKTIISIIVKYDSQIKTMISLWLSVCLFVCLSVCLCLSVSLSVSLSFTVPFFFSLSVSEGNVSS